MWFTSVLKDNSSLCDSFTLLIQSAYAVILPLSTKTIDFFNNSTAGILTDPFDPFPFSGWMTISPPSQPLKIILAKVQFIHTHTHIYRHAYIQTNTHTESHAAVVQSDREHRVLQMHLTVSWNIWYSDYNGLSIILTVVTMWWRPTGRF